MTVLSLAEQVDRVAEEMAEDDYRKRNGMPPPDPFDDWIPSDADAPDVARTATSNPNGDTKVRPQKVALSISDVIDQWRTEGPLVHEPTRIAKLDEHTDGGPVYGSRWFVIGAPDAGKTGLLLQIGHQMAENGVCVGFVAVDEEPGDLLTRFVQRSGWCRKDCETRFPDKLQAMERELRELPVRFYNGVTIETAAAQLAKFAKERAGEGRPRACLIVDSLQTVSCNAESAGDRDMSERAAATARALAVRSVATKHRLIALCTSEMNRSGYRTREAAEAANDMATAAESRAVEYQGRVVLALRSVADEKDLVEIRVPKNKHRPPGVDPKRNIYLRLDRACQTFTETNYTPPPAASADAKAKDRVVTDAVTVAEALRDDPGLGKRDLRAEVRKRTGAGSDRVDAALRLLGEGVAYGKGRNNSKPMTLNLDELPAAVRIVLEGP